MSNTFKVGDRVKCIDAGSNRFIKRGEHYTVSGDESEGMVEIGGEVGARYYSHRFELVTPAAERATETYDTYTPAMLPMFTKLAEEADARGYCEQYDSMASIVGAPSRAEIKKLNAPADPLAAAREAFATIPLGHTFHFTGPNEVQSARHIKISDAEFMYDYGTRYGTVNLGVEDYLKYGIEAN